MRAAGDTGTGENGGGEPGLCHGRSRDELGRRVRPCTRRCTARVTGTHGLTVDLCSTHARVAVDRPRFVREWLLLEGAERAAAGLGPAAPRAGEGGPASRRLRVGALELVRPSAPTPAAG
jgi:hypothetical protein